MNDNSYRPKLIFTGEAFAGRVYELLLEKTTVGRGEENTLTIHDPSVSTAHCEILVNGPEVIVRDLGSSNGTFVKGMRLHAQQCELKSGQLVRFGSVEARLELDPAASEHTATESTAIYELGRIRRDQMRDQNNPRPANPSMKLESTSDVAAHDHTVIMSRTPQPEEKKAATEPEISERPPGKASKWIWTLFFLAVGLGVLLWLLGVGR